MICFLGRRGLGKERREDGTTERASTCRFAAPIFLSFFFFLSFCFGQSKNVKAFEVGIRKRFELEFFRPKLLRWRSHVRHTHGLIEIKYYQYIYWFYWISLREIKSKKPHEGGGGNHENSNFIQSRILVVLPEVSFREVKTE